MDEFSFIAEYLAPLAAPTAHGLSDDGATLPPVPDGQEWRISTDTLVAGVHFRETDSLQDVGYRALAVSVSDLAAQLAKPALYLLNLTAPQSTDLKPLVAGLTEAQGDFGLQLLGGDTTAGPLTLSVSVFGQGEIGLNPLRSGAKVGDRIGLIYSSPLGAAKAGFEGQEAFCSAFLRPQPCLQVLDAQGIQDIHAMADVSDGLLADLGHICAASKVGAQVWAERLPLALGGPLVPQITWGDDYALVLTAPILPDDARHIGQIIEGQGVKLLNAQGIEIPVERPGYKHL